MKRGPKQLACTSRIIRGWLLSYFFQSSGVSTFAISICAQSRDPRFSCIDETTWVDRENPTVFATISYSPPLLSHWEPITSKQSHQLTFWAKKPFEDLCPNCFCLWLTSPRRNINIQLRLARLWIYVYINMFCLYVHIMYSTVNSVL